MDLNGGSQSTVTIASDLDNEFHHIAHHSQHREFITDLHHLLEDSHNERSIRARRRRRRQLSRTSPLDALLSTAPDGNRQTENNSQATSSRMQTTLSHSIQRPNLNGFSNSGGTGGTSTSEIREVVLDIECAICMDTCREPTSTLCGHVFCLECIQIVIQNYQKCPLCKHQLSLKSIHRLYI